MARSRRTAAASKANSLDHAKEAPRNARKPSPKVVQEDPEIAAVPSDPSLGRKVRVMAKRVNSKLPAPTTSEVRRGRPKGFAPPFTKPGKGTDTREVSPPVESPEEADDGCPEKNLPDASDGIAVQASPDTDRVSDGEAADTSVETTESTREVNKAKDQRGADDLQHGGSVDKNANDQVPMEEGRRVDGADSGAGMSSSSASRDLSSADEAVRNIPCLGSELVAVACEHGGVTEACAVPTPTPTPTLQLEAVPNNSPASCTNHGVDGDVITQAVNAIIAAACTENLNQTPGTEPAQEIELCSQKAEDSVLTTSPMHPGGEKSPCPADRPADKSSSTSPVCAVAVADCDSRSSSSAAAVIASEQDREEPSASTAVEPGDRCEIDGGSPQSAAEEPDQLPATQLSQVEVTNTETATVLDDGHDVEQGMPPTPPPDIEQRPHLPDTRLNDTVPDNACSLPEHQSGNTDHKEQIQDDTQLRAMPNFTQKLLCKPLRKIVPIQSQAAGSLEATEDPLTPGKSPRKRAREESGLSEADLIGCSLDDIPLECLDGDLAALVAAPASKRSTVRASLAQAVDDLKEMNGFVMSTYRRLEAIKRRNSSKSRTGGASQRPRHMLSRPAAHIHGQH